MSSSGLWGISLCLGLAPFEGLQIELVDIIKGGSLIVDTSMSSEDNDFVFMVGHRVIGTGFWSTDFGHGVLWGSDRFLVGRLRPLESG